MSEVEETNSARARKKARGMRRSQAMLGDEEVKRRSIDEEGAVDTESKGGESYAPTLHISFRFN